MVGGVVTAVWPRNRSCGFPVCNPFDRLSCFFPVSCESKGLIISTFDRTSQFHEVFGHPVRATPQVIPTEDEAFLALALIHEELDELALAMFDGSIRIRMEVDEEVTYNPDLIEIADAIGDLDVVVNGAGLRHGFDMEKLGEAVHKSNMSKLGADGKPIYSRGMEIDGKPEGKIMKSPLFMEPDIAGAIGV